MKLCEMLDKDVGQISPHPDKYEEVVQLVKIISRKTKPKECHSQYVQGLTGDTKSLLDRYQALYNQEPGQLKLEKS